MVQILSGNQANWLTTKSNDWFPWLSSELFFYKIEWFYFYFSWYGGLFVVSHNFLAELGKIGQIKGKVLCLVKWKIKCGKKSCISGKWEREQWEMTVPLYLYDKGTKPTQISTGNLCTVVDTCTAPLTVEWGPSPISCFSNYKLIIYHSCWCIVGT